MKRRGKIRGLVWLAAALTLAVALGLCARQWAFGTLRVAGTSMRNTLTGGDIALVTRFDYLNGGAPKRFEVVECRFPGRGDTYIKRVIGLPGEEIAFVGGALYIDGAAVAEPYVFSPTQDYSILLGEDEYLVLGDNRADSYDSRMADMGPVGPDAFLGRVRWIIWPLGRFGPVQ